MRNILLYTVCQLFGLSRYSSSWNIIVMDIKNLKFFKLEKTGIILLLRTMGECWEKGPDRQNFFFLK